MAIESIERSRTVAAEWANIITSWEKSHGRSLPWRENRTPYKVFISEILSKRSNPNSTESVYKEFIRLYPDIKSLSKASLTDLESLIKPLGLYKQKSRIMKELTAIIIEEFAGQVPSDLQTLRELPNIGEYTASAIICFAYRKPVITIGSNVDRILSRVFSARSTDIRTIAEILLDKNEPDIYNYGLLDLGVVCHFTHPKCQICPVNHFVIIKGEEITVYSFINAAINILTFFNH